MAFDGNGNFVRLYNWQQDAANGIDITASRVDAEDSGFAAGLSNCVTRDGQGKPSADLLPATDNNLNLGSNAFRWQSFNGVAAGFVIPLFRSKSATTSFTSAALAPDPDLSVPLDVGSYRFEFFLDIWGSGGVNQGFQLQPTFSGTSPRMLSQLTSAPSNVLAAGNFFFSNTTFASSRNENIAVLKGMLVTTTSGTFSLNWSTRTNTGNPTNIGDGSYMAVSLIPPA